MEQDGVNFTWLSIVFCFRQPMGSLACLHPALFSHQPTAKAHSCWCQLIFYVVCIESLLHNLFCSVVICRRRG